MQTVYLDCSGLHSIRLENNLPNSIYIDGHEFLSRFNSAIEMIPQPDSKEKNLELTVKLVLAKLEIQKVKFNDYDWNHISRENQKQLEETLTEIDTLLTQIKSEK